MLMFDVVTVNNYSVITVETFLQNPKKYCQPIQLITLKPRSKKECKYYELYCGFDIETYTIPENHHAYMYIWQFSMYGKENCVIYGRTWLDFKKLIESIKDVLHLHKSRRIIIGIANLGYEFQFLRHQYSWSKIFAKEIRQPIYAIMDGCIELRDILQITGGSLQSLASEYCYTKKLVGDLDYTIARNNKTSILTDKEMQYCINDVVIVAEFMKYIFRTYIMPQKFIPLTKTGLLRREVKKGCSYGAKMEIYRCFPADYSLYKNLMLWCFRGGYTHGNILYMNKIITTSGYDITSSYPYTMLAFDGFPVSPLLKENADTFQDRLKTHCVIFHAVFYNLKAKTPHAIESLSKCINISDNRIIDNGRIRSCDYCEVWLTNLDYEIYNDYYTFTKMEILEMYTSIKGRLPTYLLRPLWQAYEKKAKLKREGKSNTTEYALYKSYVNSAYGMTVTRLSEKEYVLDENNEWSVISDFDYEREKTKSFLLPQWGIFVCAYSRYRLLKTLIKIKAGDTYEGVYCDTDSIKYVNSYDDIFINDNKNTEKIMKGVCKKYGLDFEIFHDLGSWEKEYTNVKSKFLGAKRYILTDEKGNIKTTIAGLPKKALLEYCKKNNKNPYDVFTHKMLIDIDVSFKNASCYNDTPHSDIIEGVKMMELSSVGIFPIEFTMKLNEIYLAEILKLKERYSKNENRIY